MKNLTNSLVAKAIAKDWIQTPKTLPIDAVAVEADCATELLQEVMMVADEVLTEEFEYDFLREVGKQIHDQIVKQMDRQFLQTMITTPGGII